MSFLWGDQLDKQDVGMLGQMDFQFGSGNIGRGERMFAPQRALQESNLRRMLNQGQERLQSAPGLTAAAREQMQQGLFGQYQQGMMDTGSQFASMANQADLSIWGAENQALTSGYGMNEQIRASRFTNQGGGFMDWLGGAASGFIGGVGEGLGKSIGGG